MFRERPREKKGEKARSVECEEREEKGRQRRPRGALKEEDKERKKKELSLKIVYSLRANIPKNRVLKIEEARSLKEDFEEDKEN